MSHGSWIKFTGIREIIMCDHNLKQLNLILTSFCQLFCQLILTWHSNLLAEKYIWHPPLTTQWPCTSFTMSCIMFHPCLEDFLIAFRWNYTILVGCQNHLSLHQDIFQMVWLGWMSSICHLRQAQINAINIISSVTPLPLLGIL
jgi:hypothetical protein